MKIYLLSWGGTPPPAGGMEEYWSGHASLRRHYATVFVKYFLLSQLRTTHETNTFYFLTTHYAEGLDIHTYFTTQNTFKLEAQNVRNLSKLCVATQLCFSNTFYFRNYALRTTKILSTFFTTHYAEPPDIHTFVAHACPLQYHNWYRNRKPLEPEQYRFQHR